MSKILTINNVHAYIDGNGVAQLNLEDCARGLGFTEKAASGNETIRWRTVKSYLSSFNTIATTCDDVPDFIPENIFYRLAMKAKNETAEKFQSIVCDEILPVIRKTGTYSIIPKDYGSALRELAATWEREQQALKLLEIAQPKIEFFDAVADSKDAVEMNAVAKVLAFPKMGRNNLFEFLRNQKILMNNNQPFQKFIDNGYFRVIEQKYMRKGEQCITFKTLVYNKGLDYIRKMLNRELAGI